MEIEEIKVQDRAKMHGLKNKGMIEFLEDPQGDFILIIGKGIRRKWLLFNLPEGMWSIRCSRGELWDVVREVLKEKILATEEL